MPEKKEEDKEKWFMPEKEWQDIKKKAGESSVLADQIRKGKKNRGWMDRFIKKYKKTVEPIGKVKPSKERQTKLKGKSSAISNRKKWLRRLEHSGASADEISALEGKSDEEAEVYVKSIEKKYSKKKTSKPKWSPKPTVRIYKDKDDLIKDIKRR